MAAAEVGAGDSQLHDRLVVVDNFVAAKKLKRKSNTICSIFKKLARDRLKRIGILFIFYYF